MSWAAIAAIVTVFLTALVWIFESKPVACVMASDQGSCGADARLAPAIWASVVLIGLLLVAMVLAFATSSGRRSTIMKPAIASLVVVGLVASGTVLTSAGFTLWPIWA